MSEAVVRALIDTIVSAVSGTQNVYDYERHVGDWSAMLDLFKTSADKWHGWTITCQSFPQVHTSIGTDKHIVRTYTYKVRGYYAFDDSAASEKVFMVIVEDVVEALDADSTLHGTGYLGNDPADLTLYEPRFFGGVLCHYAEITQTAKEQMS